MKKVWLKVLCLSLCFVLVLTAFAGCKNGAEGGDEPTTSVDGGDWSQGVPSDTVELTKAELVKFVKETLGDKAKNFSGDLSSLSAADLAALEKAADAKGYIFETDSDGKPSIKKQVALVLLPTDEVVELVKNTLGNEAKDFNGNLSSLTDEQLEKVESAAEEKGYYLITDGTGSLVIKKEDKVNTATKEEQKELKEIVEEVLGEDASSFNGDTSTLTPEQKKELESKLAEEGVSPSEAAEIITKVITTAPASSKIKTTKRNQTGKITQREQKYTNSPSSYTPQVVSAINKVWNKTHDAGNATFSACKSTSDGGAVAVGTKATGPSSAQALIAKYDKDGKVVWNEVLEDGYYYQDVAVLKDGSVIVCGYSFTKDLAKYNATFACGNGCGGTGDAMIVKYSAKGSRQWVKFFGGTGDEMAFSIAETPDGGVLVGGKTTSTDGDFAQISTSLPNHSSAFLVKFTDANCSKIAWCKHMTSSKYCSYDGVSVAPNGDIFAAIDVKLADADFASVAGAEIGREKTLIVKYTASAGNVWQRFITSSALAYTPAILATNDGGCVIAGSTTSKKPTLDDDGRAGTFSDVYNGGNSGTRDGAVIKLGADGSITWKSMFIGFNNDEITDIIAVKNGYAVVGTTTSTNRDFASMPGTGDFDSFVCTINAFGTKTSMASLGGSEADKANAICALPGDGVFICGSTSSADVDFAGCTPVGSSNSAVSFATRFDIKYAN